ncbi:hypothetical protein [Nocardia terpenica]|uniref:Uncharacterized protein n=1 Tax=Nocardia terpenica TaxID=455432 RepID=A0A6G9YZM4_9NOCA|nr:hypothetical protein [Nocardia terpenica]QIS18571.1 hypothetical protein F6W96_09965 [Nocardia terpenica]
MPKTIQTVDVTGVLDTEGHPILFAEGPVTGPISVQYRYRGLDGRGYDTWCLHMRLSPLFDRAEQSLPEYVTINGREYTGHRNIVIESRGPHPTSVGATEDHCTRRVGGGVVTTAAIDHLDELFPQIVAFWHTPARLHEAKVQYAQDRIADVETKFIRATAEYHRDLEASHRALDALLRQQP